MAQGPAEGGLVDGSQNAHDGVFLFTMKLAANEEGTEDRNQGDGEKSGADHGKRFGEGQGMKHLAFHAGQRKDWNESQDDDDHGEGYGPADQAGGAECDFDNVVAIVAVLLFELFGLADDVLRHDDACVNEYADGDGNATERHDVGRDACAFHEEEGAENGKRQRNGDDQDAAEVPEKQHVRERDQDEFFNERVAEGVDGVVDQDAAVIKGDDLDAGRKPRF